MTTKPVAPVAPVEPVKPVKKVINLTPHKIVFRDQAGNDHVFPPSGLLARAESAEQVPGAPLVVNDVAIAMQSAPSFLGVYITGDAGERENFPAPAEGVAYLVSSLVLGQLNRDDVFAPATGPNDGAVRNEKGHIVAVTRLNRAKRNA